MGPYQGRMRALLGVVLATLLASPGPAGIAVADEEDHDRARAALKAGEIQPLREIMSSVQVRCGGRVIEAELEEGSRDGRRMWLYQLRMLMPRGDVLRLDVDAATKEILKVKGRGADEACR
jgi:uncharacterized membrane protein YkoI